MKRLLLFVTAAFLFTTMNNAQSSFDADDVAALKSLMLTGTNPGLLEKVWTGQDDQRPDPTDENDTQWNQVNWKTDIKGLSWDDSGKLLEIDWNNFGSPETDYISGLLSIADLKHLTTFYCYNNGLTGLMLKNLPVLSEIEVGYNAIINFVTDATPEISNIDFINNKFTKLTLTGYPKLAYLNCSHNELTTLNVNDLTGLKLLDCGDNQLTALDISNLTHMENLFCYNNKLKELAVYTNAPWEELSCGDNNLPFSQLPAESEISGDYKYTPQILTATLNGGESYVFDQGSHTGTIGVASCTKEDGTELTGYKIENATFTPPSGFSGKLIAYITHSDFPKFNTGGYEYDYMELHLTVEAGEKYSVILPEIEEASTEPIAGTYEVGKGDLFEFTLTLAEGYEGSVVKVYSNNDLLEPVKIETIRFFYKVENITKDITFKIEVLKKNIHAVTLPEVEGVTTEPAAGTHKVAEGDPFEFTLTLLEDYDQSDVKVYVNGDLLWYNPATELFDVVNRSYTYTIENITEAITITIEGVKKNDPSSNESLLKDQDYRIYTEGSMFYIDSRKQVFLTIYGIDGQKYIGHEIPVGITSVSLSKGVYIVVVGEDRLKIVVGN